MFGWASNLFRSQDGLAAERAALGREREATRKERLAHLRARYDAAQTTDENRRHWSMADGLSARSANSLPVRKRLRERARYEVANNSYAWGMVDTLANDIVGTGPRLQMLTESDEINSAVETRFAEWCKAVGFAQKLRTMVFSKITDGEGIAILTNNRTLPTSVKLDFRLIESDQMTSPMAPNRPRQWVDGIIFDTEWNVVGYDILKVHPGDTFVSTYNPLDYDTIKASKVIHWFKAMRPGQARGIPEITPALPLFAQLRRYTLATLSAAEIAASFAAMLESDAPPDGDTDDPTPFDTLEIERGMMTTMPAGWKMSQMRAEQPTTTYGEFKKEILNEIGRCKNMPFNVMACNSASYNYSSGRLDHQTYHKSIKVERNDCETICLDRLFVEWLNETVMIPGYLPAGVSSLIENNPHAWYWDGFGHVDPTKEATADGLDIANCTSTLAEKCAEDGKDYQAVMRQRAKEIKFAAELGIPGPGPNDGQATNGASSANKKQASTETDNADAEEPAVKK